MSKSTKETSTPEESLEAQPQITEKKKTKGKKGKVFSTNESMLALIDQITEKQVTVVKQKLDRVKNRENFAQGQKLKQEVRKAQKQNEIEAMKNKLKQKQKAKRKASAPEPVSDKTKKQVRFS